MSPYRASVLKLGMGIVFLVAALLIAFSSYSIRLFEFRPPTIGYNPYLELLAFVAAGVGGFFIFRAGQLRPASHAPSKTLAEQVKDVVET
jgi:hypothetical protein